jgi:transposase
VWWVVEVRPGVWQPPVACSRLEREVIKRIKRAKLFVWLREHRHELFDEQLQAELAGMYQDAQAGQPPVPPAQLGLATILQAYTGASDDEVIEATVMDRRWQLVLTAWTTQWRRFRKRRWSPSARGWSPTSWTGGWWSAR